MALIHVPRPKDAYNPDRPVGSLLKTQVEHLREAESKLPLRYHRKIDTYIKAIKTEGEAAAYIRTVTEAIHAAHADADRARTAGRRKPAARRGRVVEIAAAAEKNRRQKTGRKPTTKKSKKRAPTTRRTKKK
jgi:hypothetical protein